MIRKNSLFFAYVLALLATLASLYISEALGEEACKLCWTQRVFLFPLPVLLFFVLFFRRPDVTFFLLPLPILGALASTNHIVFSLSHCDDCSNISLLPFWSLAVFLLIAFFLLLGGNLRRKSS